MDPKKGKRVKDKEKEKSVSRVKRNSQPAIIPLDSKNKSKKIRTELSYSLDNRRLEYQEENNSLIIVEKLTQERLNKKKDRKGSTTERRKVSKTKDMEGVIEKKKETEVLLTNVLILSSYLWKEEPYVEDLLSSHRGLVHIGQKSLDVKKEERSRECK